MIDTSFLSMVGFGGIVGFLIGFMLKKIMKILAVVAGIFLAVLMYLESQGIMIINWEKLQSISQGVLYKKFLNLCKQNPDQRRDSLTPEEFERIHSGSS
jgi:uncharacterized membrane protein (Fun14 family)